MEWFKKKKKRYFFVYCEFTTEKGLRSEEFPWVKYNGFVEKNYRVVMDDFVYHEQLDLFLKEKFPEAVKIVKSRAVELSKQEFLHNFFYS